MTIKQKAHNPPYGTMGLALSIDFFIPVVLTKSLNDLRLASVNI